MAGLLDPTNLLNPWMALGSACCPLSGQMNPANATFGAGLSQGLNNLSGLEQMNLQKSALENDSLIKQQRLAILKRQQEAAAQELVREQQMRQQRRRGLGGLLDMVQDPAKKEYIKNLIDVDPAMAAKEAGGLLYPKPEESWSAPYLDNRTGKPILVQRNETTGAVKAVGSGGVTVNNNTIAKPPAGFSWGPSGPGGEVVPIPGGPQDPNRVSPTEARKARETERETAKAKKTLEGFIDDYTKLGVGASGLSPGDRAKVQQARRNLAVAIARARDPSGRLTDADIELAMEDVPDPFGPIDSFTFKESMKNLKRLLVGESPPPEGFVEDSK